MNRNADGSPSDSSSGILLSGPTTINEGDDAGSERNYDSDLDERLSEISSVGSVAGIDGQPLTAKDFFDLTSPSFCRVYLTRTENGDKIFGVCGCKKTVCTRKGHREKSSMEQDRAPPRYYEQFPVIRGRDRGTIDGRLDRHKVGLTAEEIQRMQSAEDAEMSRVARALGEEEEEDRTGREDEANDQVELEGMTELQEAVTNAEHTIDAALDELRDEGLSHPGETLVTWGRDRTHAIPGTRSNPIRPQDSPTATQQRLDTHPVPDLRLPHAESLTDRWYGVSEFGTNIRRIVNNLEDLNYWIDRNATISSFRTKGLALEWVKATRRLPDSRRRWFGLRKDGAPRRLCRELEELEVLTENGYTHSQTFTDRESAEQWRDHPELNQGRVDNASSTRPSRRGHGNEPRTQIAQRQPDTSTIQRASEEAQGLTEEWYGLLEPPEDSRVICMLKSERDDLMREGAEWRRVFPNENEARTWLGGRNAQHPTQTTEQPRDLGPDTGHDHLLKELYASHEKQQGEDPSSGDESRIHGIEIADSTPMEEELCPPGLDESDRIDFQNLSTDVASLPGTYVSDSTDLVSSGEELAISCYSRWKQSERRQQDMILFGKRRERIALDM